MNKVRETVVSIGAPVDKNVIWIDISGTEPIQKIFLNGEWKPLKDSDVDAEFANGQKVSETYIQQGSEGSSSALATVGFVADYFVLSNWYKELTPTLVNTEYTVNISATPDISFNYNIKPAEGTHNADIININIATPIDPSDEDLDYLDGVTTIRFTSSATPTAISYVEADILWANDELPICEANTEYLIAIWKNVGVMTKVKKIPVSNS